MLENPTNPQDPLSTNLAGLGLHLSTDPDKLQDSIYLEESIMAIFPPSPTDLTVIQRIKALQMPDSLNPSIVLSSLTIFLTSMLI